MAIILLMIKHTMIIIDNTLLQFRTTSISTLYGRQYIITCPLPTNACCDTTYCRELWYVDKRNFQEKVYDKQKLPSTYIRFQNNSDTLYVYFMNKDTCYAFSNLEIQLYTPSKPLFLSKPILRELQASVPLMQSTENMDIFYQEKKRARNTINSEISIWIDSKNHLMTHLLMYQDSVKRTEFWSWQAWNVRIPDTIFILPSTLTVTHKNKAFYDTLFPPEPEIIYKKSVIPPISTWWFFFKIHLKRLFH